MYCLVVTDAYSRFTWVFFLASKDETSSILKTFITGIENLVNHKVKVIRCDNRTEFKNREMNQAEAVNTTCYVQNRVLVVKPYNKTPYELFHGRTPALSFMRPFGCPVTILNTKDHLGKFDGKANEGFFVGYSLNSIAFRVFNNRTRIVEENLHIRFNENTPNIGESGPNWHFDIDALTKSMNFKPVIAGNQSNGNACTKACDGVVNDIGANTNNELPFDLDMLALEDITTFNLSSDQEDADEEADINNMDTTIQVSPTSTIRIHKDRPLDQVIGDLHSTTQTRNMSKNLEEHGIEAIRLFLAYASFKDFVYQMDVKSGFLYGKIEEEVCVCEPPGFEDPDFPNKVYKVGKALYRLHQALRAWPCSSEGTKMIFCFFQVYVDDIIFGLTKKDLCNEFEKMMHEKFQMSSMGELTFFLGLQVEQNQDGMFISQDKYVAEILKKYVFSKVKNASTLMVTQKPLLKDEDGEEVDVHMYRSMIRSLMYLTSLRPDIMFVVYACARYQVNPKVSHRYAVRRIFRDLQLEDAEGVDRLPNDIIFEQLTLMGGTMAFAIICLATNQKFNFSQYILNSMVKNLDNVSKFLMYPRFVQVFLNNQLEEMSHHTRIYVTPSYTKKIFGNVKRVGKGFFRRDTPLFPTMMVQAQEEMGECSANPTDLHHTPTIIQPLTSQHQKKPKSRKSKRKNTQLPQTSVPTSVADEAVNEEMNDSLERAATTATSLDAKQDRGNIFKTQSKATPNESGVNMPRSGDDSLKINELMELCTNLHNRVLDLETTKTTQAMEIESLKRRQEWNPLKIKVWGEEDASKQERIADIDSNEDIYLVNVHKDKDIFGVNDSDGDEEVDAAQVQVTTTATTPTISIDEATLAQVLAELKHAKLKAKAKGIVSHELKESTTTTTAAAIPSQIKDKGKGKMVEPEPMKKFSKKDQLQAEEQDELTDAEKAKLFMEFLEKRRKFFAAKRAKEKRNIPPTKAQQRTIITELLEKSSKKAEAEITQGSSKTAGDEIEQERSKKQKVKSVDNMDSFLLHNLKTMFEHHVEDNNILYYLLVKKMYPLTNHKLHQMFNDVKLQVDYECEMTFELLRLMKKQLKESYVSE
nr:hypothetical protein [Tanacetum cinerariifolium]